MQARYRPSANRFAQAAFSIRAGSLLLATFPAKSEQGSELRTLSLFAVSLPEVFQLTASILL